MGSLVVAKNGHLHFYEFCRGSLSAPASGSLILLELVAESFLSRSRSELQGKEAK